MEIFYSKECLKHAPEFEILSGSPKPYFESPNRLTVIHEHLSKNTLFTFVKPHDYGIGTILRVHEREYIEYLQSAYKDWVRDGGEQTGILGECFPHPKLLAEMAPDSNAWKEMGKKHVLSKASLYSFDLSTVITGDTWHSAYAAAQTTLTAAHRLLELWTNAVDKSKPIATYSLVRPPGHHAGVDICGGYCYINNVAVATQFLMENDLTSMDNLLQGSNVVVNKKDSFRKILILDLDYHHGNGTQQIFYTRSNPFYLSLHCSPDYPWFTGSVSEIGAEAGKGSTLNLPLPKQTTGSEYIKVLTDALANEHVIGFGADMIIVSLGFDTFGMDPIGGFEGWTDVQHYTEIGALIASSPATKGKPCLFVQEGGYWIGELGTMVENVLEGFLGIEKKET